MYKIPEDVKRIPIQKFQSISKQKNPRCETNSDPKFQSIFETKTPKKCPHVKSIPDFYSANMFSMHEIGGSEYTPYGTRPNVDDRT